MGYITPVSEINSNFRITHGKILSFLVEGEQGPYLTDVTKIKNIRVAITKDCTQPSITYDMSPLPTFYSLNLGVESLYFTIPPHATFTAGTDTVSGQPYYKDGVYNVSVTISTFVSNGVINNITYKSCIVVDCDLKTQYVNYQKETYSKNLENLYQSLFYSDTCDACDCNNLCTIWNEITSILNSTTTNVSTDCGCQ